MMLTVTIGLLCLALVATCGSTCSAAPCLWDMKSLRQPPGFDVINTDGNLRTIYYPGEPYQGKPTRTFAYLATPENLKGKAPAIVLVHGGAGRAFADWARLWASRGYVALAMDHFGQGPDGKHTDDGGPNLDPGTIYPSSPTDGWTYHAVAKVVRGISLVASLPEVDPKRIGITGVSWGGYLTCIVAGIDSRVKAAAPIYGCGYLYEDSIWSAEIQALPQDKRQVWINSLDPAIYLPQAKAPMLFVNGATDPCFWLDSYQKSYLLVKNRAVCLKVGLHHDQEQGSSQPEIQVFMDHCLQGGKGLPEISAPKQQGNSVKSTFKSPVDVSKAELCYTTDSGPWKDRKWQTMDAKISGNAIAADLPAQRPLTYFISLTDTRGTRVTTQYQLLAQ